MRALDDCIKDDKRKADKMSEEEIIQTLEIMVKSWDNIREDCKNSGLSKEIEHIEKENKAIQGLLDLYEEEKNRTMVFAVVLDKQESKIKSLQKELEIRGLYDGDK